MKNTLYKQILISIFLPLFVIIAIIKFAPPSIASLILNPEKFMEIAQYKQKKEEEKSSKEKSKAIKEDIAKTDGNLLGNKFDPVIGSGEVAIVEYLDYKCGYCNKAHNEIKKLLVDTKYQGKFRVIIKNYPVIGGEVSLYAAEIATAFFAKSPEKFLEFHDALFNSKLNSTKDVDKVLAKFGFKPEEIQNEAIRPAIIENFNFARNINISGTPAFIVGEEILGGFVTKEKLAEAIDAQLNAKK